MTTEEKVFELVKTFGLNGALYLVTEILSLKVTWNDKQFISDTDDNNIKQKDTKIFWVNLHKILSKHASIRI